METPSSLEVRGVLAPVSPEFEPPGVVTGPIAAHVAPLLFAKWFGDRLTDPLISRRSAHRLRPRAAHTFVVCGKDFLLTIRKYSGPVPKKDRVWLAEASKLAKEHFSNRSVFWKGLPRGGRRPTCAMGQTHESALVRRRLHQGAPYKVPQLRELLWDWFVDTRRSVATTISPRFVLLKARQIADKLLAEQRRNGVLEAFPNLDRHWLLRWKRDKGVVFRKPNLRYKCSRVVLKMRLRAMWLNTIRVRRVAEIFLHNDLSQSVWGIDEKPLHFNESGSKCVRTLEIAGAPAVALKQNHAATRERCTVMTCVTSAPAASASPALLPLEVLFRAKTDRRTRSLVVPPDMLVRVQWAEKGSYRQENILLWMERFLEEWTPDRALRRDYRILFLDMAKSHLGDPVVEFAWRRGQHVRFAGFPGEALSRVGHRQSVQLKVAGGRLVQGRAGLGLSTVATNSGCSLRRCLPRVSPPTALEPRVCR